MLNHYWSRLRAADATWQRAHADPDDSTRTDLPPSWLAALSVLIVGTGVALIGISFYLGLI